jgi:hypothetical protein
VRTPVAAKPKLLDQVRGLTRARTSPLFEIALVIVRLDHLASCIVNANYSIM